MGKDNSHGPRVTIIDSWKLNRRNEILADIQHTLFGLPAGTILESGISGLKWQVVARMIFTQVENQARFSGETEHFQRFTFRPIENLEKFIQDIQQKEAAGIYHYAIQPVVHEKKPENGEILYVWSTDDDPATEAHPTVGTK